MENENKDLQGTVEETELQEKVRQDVSEKIAEAAAELQEDIEAAEEVAEEMDSEELEELAELEVLDGVEEGLEGEEELEAEEEVKEPKIITMKLSSLVMSLISTAVIGALVLLFAMQIPKWVEKMPEGSTIASAGDIKITDEDIKYYIYAAAIEYFQGNAASTSTTPAEFDWAQDVNGKTAEEIVRENALKMALDNELLIREGEKNDIAYDDEITDLRIQINKMEMVQQLGEDGAALYANAYGIGSLKQYGRLMAQLMKTQAVDEDRQQNPDKYYPEDKSVLNSYMNDQAATYKQIMIKKDTTVTDEAAKAASDAEKRAKAEEVLARLNSGEDFETVMNEVSEDKMQPADGYTVQSGSAFLDDVSKAALGMGADGNSEIIETEDGFVIIKRFVGQDELSAYWKDQAKVKVNEKKLAKISVKDLLTRADEAATEVDRITAEMQNAQ